MNYDKVIIGAGIFGLYAAQKCLEKGETVLVLEYDDAPFQRASWINQARVHNGYHYPRSFSTALKSAYYFNRFVEEYNFAILQNIKKIYATSRKFSYTNAEQFKKFCMAAEIHCEPINMEQYFKSGVCDGAFETREYTFDAKMICEYIFKKLLCSPKFTIQFSCRIHKIYTQNNTWRITTNNETIETPYLINASYASLNQILLKAGLEPFKMKYELCEVILCAVSDNIKNIGLTVMDGPFFSLMPFGKTGYSSLTAVGSTPHLFSKSTLPTFDCQRKNIECSHEQLANCNDCNFKPKTNFADMLKLAKKYLNENIEINYQKSLFSMKTILLSSEIDDSRPTIIKLSRENPAFLSIFSGKINSIYDLDGVL